MRYLFISDLHLGSALYSDRCTKPIIDLLARSYDKRFIVGDIISNWGCDVDITIKSYRELLSAMDGPNTTILRGNRDPSIERLKEVFSKSTVTEIYEDHHESLVVLHGHQYHAFLRERSMFSKCLSFMQWPLLSIGINPRSYIEDSYMAISTIKDTSVYDTLVVNLEMNMINLFRSNFDYIVMGHTHCPKIINSKDYTYANCGDMVHNYSYCELIDGEFKLGFI